MLVEATLGFAISMQRDRDDHLRAIQGLASLQIGEQLDQPLRRVWLPFQFKHGNAHGSLV